MQETVHNDGVPNNKDQDRQRIRARLGAYSEINPQVDTGIRIATGSNDDARSTNQDLNNYFDKKSIWLDQGYVDYHPDAIKNLHLIGGKMPQPWVSMGDIIWDSDINPEGLAATYKYPLGGSTELFGSAGHYTLKDNVDGEGVQFKHDLRLYAGQLGARFAITDSMKMTLGGSIYSLRQRQEQRLPYHRHRHRAMRTGRQRQQPERNVQTVRRLWSARLQQPASTALVVRSVRQQQRREQRSGHWLVGRCEVQDLRLRSGLQLPRCTA